jgi:uncharacterized protein YdaU (DUF1376 family)
LNLRLLRPEGLRYERLARKDGLWYCEYVKNITVSLDDDTYRRARMIAAERDTSISALVKEFLGRLGSGESQVERLKREERALRERITSFRASNRQSREEVHDRARS